MNQNKDQSKKDLEKNSKSFYVILIFIYIFIIKKGKSEDFPHGDLLHTS